MKTNCKTRDNAVQSSCKWFPYNKGGDFRNGTAMMSML